MILTIVMIAAILVYLIYRLPGGCGGSCEQGRKECDCGRMK